MPQLSCGDTCQIWMWFRESNRYFCNIEYFAYGEISERSFSNPHPWFSVNDPVSAQKYCTCHSLLADLRAQIIRCTNCSLCMCLILCQDSSDSEITQFDHILAVQEDIAGFQIWKTDTYVPIRIIQDYIIMSKRFSALPDLCVGIHRWPVNSPHKRPVMRDNYAFVVASLNELSKPSICRWFGTPWGSCDFTVISMNWQLPFGSTWTLK